MTGKIYVLGLNDEDWAYLFPFRMNRHSTHCQPLINRLYDGQPSRVGFWDFIAVETVQG